MSDLLDTIREIELETRAAIDRAQANASDLWFRGAMNAVRYLVAQRRPFTTDDVWSHVEGQTHEPRAMGAVMRQAQRDGLIKPSGEYRKSLRPECHRRPIQVWIPL